MRSATRSGVLLLLVASAVLVASAPAAASPAPSANPPLQYVALGDSYSAGLGLEPLTGMPVPACAQSGANYPHRIAAQLGLDLTDVSCSGATTADILGSGQFAGADRQLDALSDATDIVTLTIGGNDLGFTTVVAACAAESAEGPLLQIPGLDECASFFAAAGAENPTALLADVVAPALDSTFAAIARAAPNARVFVLGYPNLFRDAVSIPTGGCFTPLGTSPSAFPFGTTDVAYLHSLETELDAAIQAAAADSGAAYVSTFADSEGHDICAGADAAYVNGAIVAESGLASPSLHPNERGTAFLAAEASAAIEESLSGEAGSAGEPAPTDDPAPAGQPAAASAPLVPLFVGGALLAIVALAFALGAARRRRLRGRP